VNSEESRKSVRKLPL